MSNPKQKNRTLFYRRVSWIDNPNNLENLLLSAHQILPTTKHRTFIHNEYEIQGLAIKHEKDVGLFFHVASCIPNQPTSLVPHPSDAKATATSTQDPPQEHNFMEGDIFFLISGNHIVLCPSSGAREATAISYITNVFQKIGKEDIIPNFAIEPIADVNKESLLRQEGVKSIELNASLYDASVEYSERKTLRTTLLSQMAKEFLSLFSKDNDKELRDVSEKENLTVRLIVSFDARKNGGDIGRKRIESAAHKLISDEEEDGFSIVTGSGKKLKYDEIRLSEKALLETHGRSILRRDAWLKLDEYLHDLRRKGMLEQ